MFPADLWVDFKVIFFAVAIQGDPKRQLNLKEYPNFDRRPKLNKEPTSGRFQAQARPDLRIPPVCFEQYPA